MKKGNYNPKKKEKKKKEFSSFTLGARSNPLFFTSFNVFFPFHFVEGQESSREKVNLSPLQQVLSANFHCYSCIFVVRKPCSWCMDTRIFHTVDLVNLYSFPPQSIYIMLCLNSQARCCLLSPIL